MKICILGAGVSGLSSALMLLRKYQDVDITIISYGDIEQSTQTATNVYKTKDGIFQGDIGGHFFHFKNYPGIFDLLPEAQEKFSFHKKKALVKIKGVEVEAPIQKNYVNVPDEKWVSKVREELSKTKVVDDHKNLGTMLKSKFGKTLFTDFFKKYNSKMYNTDKFTELFVTKQEMIINTDVNKDMYNADFIYPKNGGIYILARMLLDEVKKYKNVKFIKDQVIKVNKYKKEVITYCCKRRYSYDYLISSIPLKNLHYLLGSKDRISFNSSKGLVINLGVKSNSKNRSINWEYYPNDDKYIYRVGSYSTVCQEMAPHSYSSIYVEAKPNVRNLKDPEKHILDFLIAEKWIDDGDISYIDFINLPINYPFSSAEIVEFIGKLNKSGIYPIGRNGTWNWKSMHNSFIDAELAIKDIERKLK